MVAITFSRQHSTDPKKGTQYSVTKGGVLQQSALTRVHNATKLNSKGEKKEYAMIYSAPSEEARFLPPLETARHIYDILNIPKSPYIMKPKAISDNGQWGLFEKCLNFGGNSLNVFFSDDSLALKKFAHEAMLGLAHLYENGLYHNDFVMRNLMLGKDGIIKTIDFGRTTRAENGICNSFNDTRFSFSDPPKKVLIDLLTKASNKASSPERELLEGLIIQTQQLTSPQELVEFSKRKEAWGEMPSNKQILEKLYKETNNLEVKEALLKLERKG